MLKPLIELIRAYVTSGTCIHGGDTTVRALGKIRTTTGRLSTDCATSVRSARRPSGGDVLLLGRLGRGAFEPLPGLPGRDPPGRRLYAGEGRASCRVPPTRERCSTARSPT